MRCVGQGSAGGSERYDECGLEIQGESRADRMRDVGPLEFVVRDTAGAPIVRSVLDAATVEKSMLVAEFYQRGDAWRIRAVGQGYVDDLQQFVERRSVTVES